MNEKAPFDECAAMLAVKILGRKWTTNILCELLMHKELFFSDLQKNIEGNYGERISARVLSEGLSRLEELTIIRRNVISETMPIRVKYSLTDKGEDFKYIFAMLKGWGLKWGGITTKKCKSYSCIHNSVPYIDMDIIDECMCWDPIIEEDEKVSSQ
ncbi:MAG: winged helix-turn-helix transcriptional regulator [Promethearchaeota archaeon]|jgi:DNA-binding HxlR family transcriptional regulator